MNTDNEKIENLKKVTLLIEAGTEPDSMNLTQKAWQSEFIFGLGREGMTRFECELAGKTKGDEISIQVEKEKLVDYFQHISIPFSLFSQNADSIYLKTKILKIDSADNREVVKALAQIASCGGECCGDGSCHF